MVVRANNQKENLKRTCIDCTHIVLSGGTNINDYHWCGLYQSIHSKVKYINNPLPLNGIPKWTPFR